VLKIDAFNAYAANGIAISLAVHGHHSEAREMFLQLREAASAIPTIWLNLALVSADMGQYANAVLLVRKRSILTCQTVLDRMSNPISIIILISMQAYPTSSSTTRTKT